MQMNVHVCMRVCICVCMRVHVCMHMFACMCVHACRIGSMVDSGGVGDGTKRHRLETAV